MDAKTLRVGRKVEIVSGCYGMTGKVVSVSSSGVTVQTGVRQLDGTWNTQEQFHFDSEGHGVAAEGTYECGPWEIATEPSKYKKALLKTLGVLNRAFRS
jgi:hypothetical protein